MKICPQCNFANEERFPACLWCNALLVNVKSTPSPDSDHPEHSARQLLRERDSRRRGQQFFAIASYTAVVVSLAAFPGLISDPWILACFGATAGFIGLAMVRRWLGQFSALIVQGSASALLVWHFGTFHFLTAFMLLGHVVLPPVFSQWADLIDGAHV